MSAPSDERRQKDTKELAPLDALLFALANDESAAATSREWAKRLLEHGERVTVPAPPTEVAPESPA